MIRGVAFDFDGGLVEEDTSKPIRGIRTLIEGLHDRHIVVAAISGRTLSDVGLRAARSGLAIDHVVTRDIPNATKGSGRLIARFGSDAGLQPCEVAAVVTDEYGFREAINAPVLSFRAGWAQFMGQYSLRLDNPSELLEYLDLFFLKTHHWFAAYDGSDALGRDIRLRALIDGNGAGRGSIRNAILAALKDKRDTHLYGASFSRILVMHLVASMYLEGLLCEGRNKADCVIYPGHSTISQPPPVIEAALVGLKFVRTNFPKNALVRWSDAVHSSKSRIERQHHRVLFANQPSSVYVPASYKVTGKRVFVLDDFTTDGFSLEAARNLLLESGAERVTALAFGKYPKRHTIAVPDPRNALKPHEQRRYTDDDFNLSSVQAVEDAAALSEFADLVPRLEGSSIGSKLFT